MAEMASRKVSAFRIDDDLLDGLQLVWERDHITVSEQVRVAIRAWLESKGVQVKKSHHGRAGTRRRP
jgi:hypothetical protein